MRKTKILATLGPASGNPERVEALVRAGIDAVRLNFSHGSADDHRAMFECARRAATNIGRHIAVLQDLQGPKMRLGKFAGGTVALRAGDLFAVTTAPRMGDATGAMSKYDGLARDVVAGDRIMLADGAVTLLVENTDGVTVRCRVQNAGVIKDNQGLNLPGVAISAPALTPKDFGDIDLGLELGVDFIAMSFVRTASDIKLLRDYVATRGREVPIIAKIERPEALEALDAILDAADGIMVARGDLAVEVSPERVPMIQKRAIRAANERGKLVITATQMLESMTKSPRPTRAEASDVANAVLDGTDAVMLSGETAVGDFPVETVSMMAAICEEAERSDIFLSLPPPAARGPGVALPTSRGEVPDGEAARIGRRASAFARACALSAVAAARDLKLSCIACFTHSGMTAAILSDLRPAAAILALTSSAETCRRMALLWGVRPLLVDIAGDTDAMVALVERGVVECGYAQPGDTVAIMMGVPVTAREETNLLKLHCVATATTPRTSNPLLPCAPPTLS